MLKMVNKKSNKQGVVLVTILFILAIAMIFIASALLLTKATRDRIYVRAEDNQARLTVTSAAESFYQALYLQEITDSTLAGMDGAVLEIVNPDMPGMESGHATQEKYGETVPADGQTIAIFEVNSGSALINFKTNIGGQIECIQMGLKLDGGGKNKSSFPNVLEIGEGGSLNHAYVGGVAGNKDAAYTGGGVNSIVVHGTGANTSVGSSIVHSTYITTGLLNATDMQFSSDVVFVGSGAGLSAWGTGTPFIMKGSDSGLYFIGTNDVLPSSMGSSSVAPYSANTSVIASNVGTLGFYGDNGGVADNLKTIYTVGSSASQSFQYSISTNADQFGQKLNDKRSTTLEGTFLTKFNTYSTTDYNMGADKPNDYTWNGVNSSMKLTSNKSTAKPISDYISLKNGNGTLTPGAYTVSGVIGGQDDMAYIHCDLSKGDYYIFVTGGLTIQGGGIIADNGTKDKYSLYIIIEAGAYINIGKASGTNANKPHGIVSSNVFKIKVEDTQDSWNKLVGQGGAAQLKQDTSPYIYIYSAGVGENTVMHTGGSSCDQGQIRFTADNGVMTAYVGLYPTSYTEGTKTFSADAGSVTVGQNVNAPNIYGRISANTVTAYHGGGIVLPYCPEPNTDGVSSKPVPQYTEYRIYDYQYYTL